MDAKLNNTAKQLARMVECAKIAGIYDTMFIAFGALLGDVRCSHNMIPGDDDLDVGFISERTTLEQEQEYLRQLRKPCPDFPMPKGLFEYRESASFREDNKKLFWCSVRGMPDSQCFKTCNWFFWTQYGYTWHSKGRNSFVKGAPKDIVGVGPEIEFMGVKIHTMSHVGSILDFWYTDWMTPRSGGNSAKKVLMEVKSWNPLKGTCRENTVA